MRQDPEFEMNQVSWRERSLFAGVFFMRKNKNERDVVATRDSRGTRTSNGRVRNRQTLSGCFGPSLVFSFSRGQLKYWLL